MSSSPWTATALWLMLSCLLAAAGCGPSVPEGFRAIPLDKLHDKIKGGWAGQMIGVAYGAPTEFRFNDRIIEDEIAWEAEMVREALNQDDLYVDMTFARVLDDVGLDATSEQFGEAFKNTEYRLWHANLAARRALRRGVKAPLSGMPEHNAHANDIDFQIEADFAGLMAPGMPQSSNDICYRAGRVMNYGDGVYGGMFVSCMYAAAYFEDDPRRLVEAGLACLPSESVYAQVIAGTLRWHGEHPDDWRAVWQEIEDKWTRREACPAGALRAFNIRADVNGAYIVLGLLYGAGDFGKTVEVSTRCGKDSDCNPASAAGVLGVSLGYEAIPDNWKGSIGEIADEKFKYTDYSLNSITESTLRRAVALAEANGGRVEDGRLLVKVQEPEAAELEQWQDWGTPVERILVDDDRWQWRGSWNRGTLSEKDKTPVRFSSRKGARASIRFEGSGAVLTGVLTPDGGKADIYLDGEQVAAVDAYQDGEKENKRYEAVWHGYSLEPGRHELRLEVRGEPMQDSQGSKITLQDLIVFRKESGP